MNEKLKMLSFIYFLFFLLTWLKKRTKCPRSGLYSGGIFTTGKYQINTMEIIKSFPIKFFTACIKLYWFTIFLFYKKKLFRIICRFRRLFKETNGKNVGFCVEKSGGGRGETRIVKATKILSSSNMDTINVTKKRKL